MKKKIFKIICFVITLLSASLLCSLSAFAVGDNCKISSVIISSDLDTVEISAEISKEFANTNKGYDIFVFKLAPYMNTSDLIELTPEKAVTINEKLSVKLDFKRTDIYSSYVFAAIINGAYTPISAPHYIDNPELFGENSSPYPEKASKKGLYSQIGSDSEQLGVAHTVISIDMNKFMSMTFKEKTEPYIKNGQSFYFYTDMLKQLDHRVKVYTEAGMNVYFNIVLGNDNGSELSLIYPNTGSGKASYYAIDTDNFSNVRYYTAFCEFMAERYSDSDISNGFVPAYILGYEVDTYSWNYAGDIGIDEYVKKYENAFRILHTAVKSVYPEGKVFASVSNVFNSSSEDTAYSIGYKPFLDKLAENIRIGGDIDWALSVDPHPSSHTTNEFWNDEKATDSLDTEYLTIKNLDVLSEYMSLDTMTYNGEVRDIIIGEFGIGGNIDDARDNDRQAASYALAYAIADKNPDIDALIYYRHVDYFAEPIKFGLWSSVSTNPLTPVSKKAIYNIFKNADTADNGAGLEMARVFCGDEIYEKYLFDYTPNAVRRVSETLPISKNDIPTGFKENKLFDLTEGTLCEFYPSNNCSYIELRQQSQNSPETSLYAKMSPVSGVTYMGISRKLDDIKLSGDYLSLKFTPVTPNPEAVTVMLRLEGKQGAEIFEGIVEMSSNSESELVFKISDFLKKADGELGMLKLWFKPSNGSLSTGEYGLWLNSFTVYSSTGLSLFFMILIIFTALILLILLFALIAYIVRHKELRNSFKGFVGKTRSKLMRFLMNKKIISRHKRKPKGARYTPPKETDAKVRSRPQALNGVARDISGSRPRVMTRSERTSRPASARITADNLQTSNSKFASEKANSPKNTQNN